MGIALLIFLSNAFLRQISEIWEKRAAPGRKPPDSEDNFDRRCGPMDVYISLDSLDNQP